MQTSLWSRISIGAALATTVVISVAAQAPARGGGAGGAQGRGGAPAQPAAPTVPQVSRTPPVDQAAHDRGRALWASHCVNCHGTQARGSETGPNIIRTKTVNYDRAAAAGSVLGPYLKAGHPTDSGKASASFTDDEVVSLAQFLRQRVNDTMRGSPIFTVGDILVGNAKAGETYFQGAGGCATCHTATTRSLAGISSRLAPVDLQQRMLFPFAAGGRGGRGAPAGPPAPNPNAVTVTLTPASGAAMSGVLVEESDFYVTFRDADGQLRVVRRSPGLKVVKTNPLQAHIDLLDRITDKQMHDVVAYLETLK